MEALKLFNITNIVAHRQLAFFRKKFFKKVIFSLFGNLFYKKLFLYKNLYFCTTITKFYNHVRHCSKSKKDYR